MLVPANPALPVPNPLAPMRNTIHWLNPQQLNVTQLPYAVRPWLLDSGSLTQRLREASEGDFRVQLLSQTWQTPRFDEARLLGLAPRQQALVREVLLMCHNQPWVFARSIIPYTSLQGSLRFLRKLQDSALGALLFKDPNLHRSRFEICMLTLPHAQIPTSNSGAIYGRRSLFHLHRQPLSVAEFFLPACRLNPHHSCTLPLSTAHRIGL